MRNESIIRPLAQPDVDACAAILADLPEWFGLEKSNRQTVAALGANPAAVAEARGEVRGFLSIERHNPRSAEIHALAVARSWHGQGLGSALIAWAEQWCVDERVPWLHVKTRGPSTPDPDYERTRAFYLAQGFDPLFESLTHWGPEDAALILVKRVEAPIRSAEVPEKLRRSAPQEEGK